VARVQRVEFGANPVMAKKLTLSRIAVHEFNRSLRIWRRLVPATDIFRAIVSERARSLKHLLQQLAVATIAMLWLSANAPKLAIKLYFVDLTISAVYVDFFEALVTMGMGISMINYLMLNEFSRVAANKLFKFDTAWALTIFLDGSNAWVLPFNVQFRFFLSNRAHKILGAAVALLSLLPFAAIVLLIYWTIFSVGVRAIGHGGITYVESALTAIGMSLSLFPIACLIAIRVPFRFEKNLSYIRWIFLTRIYRKSGLRPPRVGSWLSEGRGE